MKHIISALVENHFGVLARVSGLFSARGFNIDSLTVGETEDPTASRMTIVAHGDERVLEQIMKQLNRLVDVIRVQDLTSAESIDRELALVKIRTTAATRSDVTQIVNTFRAKIVDVQPHSITVETTGTESKIDAILELLHPFGLQEVVRTGVIAMARKSELTIAPKSTPQAASARAKKPTTKKKKKKTKR